MVRLGQKDVLFLLLLVQGVDPRADQAGQDRGGVHDGVAGWPCVVCGSVGVYYYCYYYYCYFTTTALPLLYSYYSTTANTATTLLLLLLYCYYYYTATSTTTIATTTLLLLLLLLLLLPLLLLLLLQGWGNFELSTWEKRPTRRNITGVVWNDEWHAIKMMLATKGEEKKAPSCHGTCSHKRLGAGIARWVCACVFVCCIAYAVACRRVGLRVGCMRAQGELGVGVCTVALDDTRSASVYVCKFCFSSQ